MSEKYINIYDPMYFRILIGLHNIELASDANKKILIEGLKPTQINNIIIKLGLNLDGPTKKSTAKILGDFEHKFNFIKFTEWGSMNTKRRSKYWGIKLNYYGILKYIINSTNLSDLTKCKKNHLFLYEDLKEDLIEELVKLLQNYFDSISKSIKGELFENEKDFNNVYLHYFHDKDKDICNFKQKFNHILVQDLISLQNNSNIYHFVKGFLKVILDKDVSFRLNQNIKKSSQKQLKLFLEQIKLYFESKIEKVFARDALYFINKEFN